MPDEPREVLLARVASRVVTLMPGADAVTVTLVADGTPSTVAATEESLVRLDQIQYTSGTGPCLDALRTETLVRAERTEMAQRWPAFAEVVEETGVVMSAKGIVMIHHRLGVDDAFQSLVDAFQRTNRKVHDLARLIIDDPDVVGTST